MSYAHQMVEYVLTTSAGVRLHTTSGTGEKARLPAGHQPYVLRGFSLVMNASSTTAKPVVSLRLATTAGAASATGQQFATVTVASGKAAGTIIRRSNLTQKVPVGQEVIAHVSTAATKALKCSLVAFVEPDWETDANNTKVVTATA